MLLEDVIVSSRRRSRVYCVIGAEALHTPRRVHTMTTAPNNYITDMNCYDRIRLSEDEYSF